MSCRRFAPSAKNCGDRSAHPLPNQPNKLCSLSSHAIEVSGVLLVSRSDSRLGRRLRTGQFQPTGRTFAGREYSASQAKLKPGVNQQTAEERKKSCPRFLQPSTRFL